MSWLDRIAHVLTWPGPADPADAWDAPLTDRDLAALRDIADRIHDWCDQIEERADPVRAADQRIARQLSTLTYLDDRRTT